MGRTASIAVILILAIGATLKGGAAFGTALACAAGLILIFAILNALGRGKVSAEIEVLPGAGRGGRAQVKTVLRNRGRLPMFFAYTLKAVNRYTGMTSSKRVRVMVPGRDSSESVPELTSAGSGKIRVSMEKISLYDPLWLIGIRTGTSAVGNYTVLPDIFDLSADYVLQESTTFDNEVYSPYRKGQDRSEVFQIREYEEGDSLSGIHWKLSEKTDKLMVKDPSLPLDKSIVVVVDKTAESPVSPEEAERLAELFVSLLEGLIAGGLTYRLVWQDEDGGLRMDEIQFEDDLIDAIPGLLSLPPGKGDDPATLFRNIFGKAEATHVLWVRTGTSGTVPVEEAREAFPGAVIVPVLTRADQSEYYSTLLMEGI